MRLAILTILFFLSQMGAALAGVDPAVSINLSSASGLAGEVVEITATLQILTSPAPAIVATSNHLTFVAETPIAALPDGTPDCTVNPAIDKAASAFAFLPVGCNGAACSGVVALVLSSNDSNAIDDGAVLYTCRVAIAADAAPSAYALMNDFDSALDSGNREFGGLGNDATITVGGALPSCTGDCGGNQIVTIDELIVSVGVALGVANLAVCASADADGSRAVTIDELIEAVNNALDGCPFQPELVRN